MKAEYISKCQCGALTVTWENGETNSMRPSTFKSLHITGKRQKQITYCCNHCVNHYGIDLCECGSGLKPDKCCKQGTRETLYESVPFMPMFR